MKNILLFTFILIHFVAGNTLTGQYVKTILVLDNLNYGTGEIVYGHFTIQGARMHNKSLKLEVVNASSGETAYQASIKVLDNKCSFYIPISSEMKSGTYSVDLSACIVENVTTRTEVRAVSSTINIINVGESKLLRELFSETKSLSALTPDPPINVNTQFNSNEQSHDISFSNTTSNTVTFVGVTDQSALNIFSEEKTWNQTMINSFSEKIFHTLKVVSDNNQKQFGLVGLYSDNADKLFISKSEASGLAIFLLDDFEGIHGFNLFVYQNYNVSSSAPAKNYKDRFKAVSDAIWNNIQNEADDIIKRSNIHQYFEVNTFGLKSPTLMKKNSSPKPFWNITPNTYKKFPDLMTFCKENSLELRFKTGKDNTTTPTLSPPPRFTNSYEKIEWENPFIIVDGEPENDYKKVASMKPEDIINLQIYYDKREIIPWLFAFGSNGIVKIETKNKNKINPQIRINGYQSQYTDHQTIITDAKSNNKPILIPTLCWKSNFENQSTILNVSNNSDKLPKNLIVFYSNNNKVGYTISELKY